MIYNEDCIETMRRMEPGSIDMILASPPYDDLRSYEGFSFDFDGVARGMYRVLKDGGVAVWVVADRVKNGCESGTSFRQALGFMDTGFNLYQTMIYKKKFVQPGNIRAYRKDTEYMFILSKGRPKTTNIIKDVPTYHPGAIRSTPRREKDGSFTHRPVRRVSQFGRRSNVWEFSVGGGISSKDKIAHKHPAIFPEALAEDHIRSWSNPGDLIYDPFMGSGTTAKMSILLGRRWVGSEISKKYCDLTNERTDGLVEGSRMNDTRQEELA